MEEDSSHEIKIITDFFKDGQRQGPGGEKETLEALSFIDGLSENSKILDIGCGTGAQTMVLAQNTKARIVAVDFIQEFIDKLDERIKEYNLEDRVRTVSGSMFDLKYADGGFDAIWAEGSIYNIGFSRGLREWRRLLKPGGYIAMTEISWTTESRPVEIESYWGNNYPEIDTVQNKIKVLEDSGYTPIANFALPEECWTGNYYKPLLNRMKIFLDEHGDSQEYVAFAKEMKYEYEMYKKYEDYFNYVFYVARKKVA